MKSKPPTITINFGSKQLSVPAKQFVWKLWRLATYPLSIAVGYYFFGTNGATVMAILAVLNYRGEL